MAEKSWSDFIRKISNNGKKKKTAEKISSVFFLFFFYRFLHRTAIKPRKRFCNPKWWGKEIDLNFRDSNKSVISHIDNSNLKLFLSSDPLDARWKSFRRRTADK